MDCGATIKRHHVQDHQRKCPLHIYQCPRKECSFFGNFAQYTDHIIQAHNDDVIVAFEEKQFRNKLTNSGNATGYSTKNGNQSEIKGTYEISDGTVTINTSDEGGDATWTGTVDINTRLIHLIKQYHSGQAVNYRGRFNKAFTQITGSWSPEFVPEGTFVIDFVR